MWRPRGQRHTGGQPRSKCVVAGTGGTSRVMPKVAGAGGRARSASADPPLRVSTLELFFDLVFVFAITQLTNLLAQAGQVTGKNAAQVLLIFGVLWWMYGGYAWLTTARIPSQTPE